MSLSKPLPFKERLNTDVIRNIVSFLNIADYENSKLYLETEYRSPFVEKKIALLKFIYDLLPHQRVSRFLKLYKKHQQFSIFLKLHHPDLKLNHFPIKRSWLQPLRILDRTYHFEVPVPLFDDDPLSINDGRLRHFCRVYGDLPFRFLTASIRKKIGESNPKPYEDKFFGIVDFTDDREYFYDSPQIDYEIHDDDDPDSTIAVNIKGSCRLATLYQIPFFRYQRYRYLGDAATREGCRLTSQSPGFTARLLNEGRRLAYQLKNNEMIDCFINEESLLQFDRKKRKQLRKLGFKIDIHIKTERRGGLYTREYVSGNTWRSNIGSFREEKKTSYHLKVWHKQNFTRNLVCCRRHCGPTIRVKGISAFPIYFKLAPKTKMKKLFAAYAQRRYGTQRYSNLPNSMFGQGVQQSSLRFFLDGEQINPEDDAISLELVELDQIDCVKMDEKYWRSVDAVDRESN